MSKPILIGDVRCSVEFMTCWEREKAYRFLNQNVVLGIDFILRFDFKIEKLAK